ncbi:hypothetical protein V7139_30245, partial [Neobacillus drentensis]|uniref:hypothetical protein n=1 Tax=Neobacillus drentensis TaxID=220684 RepID=UPI0030024C5D
CGPAGPGGPGGQIHLHFLQHLQDRIPIKKTFLSFGLLQVMKVFNSLLVLKTILRRKICVFLTFFDKLFL